MSARELFKAAGARFSVRRVAELQNDVQVKVTEVQAGVGKALSLQKEGQRLNLKAHILSKEADVQAVEQRVVQMENDASIVTTKLKEEGLREAVGPTPDRDVDWPGVVAIDHRDDVLGTSRVVAFTNSLHAEPRDTALDELAFVPGPLQPGLFEGTDAARIAEAARAWHQPRYRCNGGIQRGRLAADLEQMETT